MNNKKNILKYSIAGVVAFLVSLLVYLFVNLFSPCSSYFDEPTIETVPDRCKQQYLDSQSN